MKGFWIGWSASAFMFCTALYIDHGDVGFLLAAILHVALVVFWFSLGRRSA